METVNESAEERQRTLDLYATGDEGDWRNRLIWGDKKYVLSALIQEYAGAVDLIYIDPPFATGADFSFTATIPDPPDDDDDRPTKFVKEPSILEQKAYRDTWGGGLESYLQWFYETALLLHDLLRSGGSIFVHIGPNVNHLVRSLMDEIFGQANFQSEIIWKRVAARSHGRSIPFSHDCILWYSREARQIRAGAALELDGVTTLKKVTLDTSSSATFRVRLHKGRSRLRVVMPTSQTAPGYITGTSKVLTVHR